jgi:anti-sigma regulatory factor (Ser/Thr protein kinase)
VNAPAEPLSIAFRGDPGTLAEVRESVRRHLESARLEEAAVYAVDLALEELVGNTIRHGYDGGAEGRIGVDVAIQGDHVRVRITDDGRPFDPTRHPEPARPRDLATAAVGGRGVSMVRRLVRAMRYRREPGGNWIEVEVPRGTRED